ncbi:hypothetical protein GQF56_16040 [Rhodobacter sphaeroides]|jgi:hypothetical protein|uniref:Uncharacterized protein n=1 Tax=Cereibacter sphaeroides (strain ATCC 17023 / DSM 158 / JCM 6121 / CCUG 31486 / LMG 2827 / NBRC 12203 / NCIMB 8253 / ATH 2.4.1.) TaxID=272943 RepID=U5NMW1_CERS4|nr:hypothetical protein RSP_7620 [Cereibacter sphaeroides 2.4.1]MVX49363.1 hypothetical protein [Cereibacter sphaeroides]AXC63552.1 hypothetical protein DQL45_19425 [Cereibacter sphaeroides 2.4.1]QHA11971.1 hypothetical protein GQR99_19410 [Cereibacter sphaeroides]QHA15126.1 hypothetical protein GQY06_19370 [Cereibacter sphaeroides]
MSNRRPPSPSPLQRRGLVFGFPGPTVVDNINSLPVRHVPLSLATRKWRSGLGWREFLALQGGRPPFRTRRKFWQVWF